MLEELLNLLVREAKMHGAVAGNTLPDGMRIFSYPTEQGVLVAFGLGPHSGIDRALLLRRRAADIARYGAWLPAVFSDGSCYLVTRVMHLPDDTSVLSEDALAVPVELLL